MITDYAGLVASVSNWLHRADLAPIVPDLIMLAEQRMNADLKSRHMDTTVTLTCTGDVSTVAMPDDLLEVRRLKVLADPAQVLKYLSPDQLAQTYAIADARMPINFTAIGNDFELGPTPDQDYPLELVYCQAIPALSSANTSNWLLAGHPNAYLFGALCEAQPYLKDDARVAVWDQKYKEAVSGINSIDWYSGSTMRVSVR